VEALPLGHMIRAVEAGEVGHAVDHVVSASPVAAKSSSLVGGGIGLVGDGREEIAYPARRMSVGLILCDVCRVDGREKMERR